MCNALLLAFFGKNSLKESKRSCKKVFLPTGIEGFQLYSKKKNLFLTCRQMQP